ncbi:Dipeptide transport system permease protein DppC [Serinicoccus hydrothermalis]|uniref:Dipeptide transport system permease protein DppC n=1 Tax=Serinicoccus hydrothermalis TaxID=1758689 RepID=A0A1B1NG45_9MICO|nr:Dipeptide transport system permease protein DppC [Serinicoccus hydrothermalis]
MTDTHDTTSRPGDTKQGSSRRSALTALGDRKKERIDALAEAGSLSSDEGVSLWQSAWRRLRRDPVFLVGLAIITVFVIIAAIAPWIAPHDPSARLLIGQVSPATPIPPPQEGFPLGGDNAGRDTLSRLIVGSRQTLIVGVMATLGGLVGGMTLGTIAGGIGGWADSLVMRIVDVMLSIPSLLMAFSIAALFARPSQWTVIAAIAIIQVPIFARLLRGSMISQRHSDHVLAARALGVKPAAIVFRHMLPNSLGPVIVQGTLVLAVSIIDAAALSFLGLGSQDDSVPEWGQMLGRAQVFFNSYPEVAVYPAVCIIVVALGFTLMGESLREALDPKSRR